jgi:hypothetical protein
VQSREKQPAEKAQMPENPRTADGNACTGLRALPRKRALSFLSLFRRQCPAAASAGTIQRTNGLPGFVEKYRERDPVHHSGERRSRIFVDTPIEGIMNCADCGTSPNSAAR